MPVCSPCGRSFIDKQALLMHTKSKHPPVFECTYCDRTFKTYQGRDQHEKSKHLPEYECTYCCRTFKTEKGREQHEETKHPGYECTHCDRRFMTEGGRDQHERTTHPEPEYECTHCDRTFTTEGGRDQHERTKHPEPEYECTYCCRTFKTEKGRDQHEETKHPDYECTHCDRTFTTEGGRDQHERTKHPESGYECTHCDRTFTTEDGRDQHERAKHVCCDYCDKTFRSEDALEQHDKAVHPGYECTYCGEEYLSENYRLQHEAAEHTGSQRLTTVHSSSYQLRDPVHFSFAQFAAAKPNVVPDVLFTRESTPAPSDDHSEASPDDHSEAPPDDHTGASSDDDTEAPSDDNSGASSDDDTEAPSDDNSGASSDNDTEAPSDDQSEAPSDDDSEASPDDYNEASSDDHSDVVSDGRSEVASHDHSDVPSDDRSKFSIIKEWVTATKPVANFACGVCGEYFATILVLMDHESREHAELCACQICERAGRPCSCGICQRAGTSSVLGENEKSAVSSGLEQTALSLDSPGVIEPKAVEDSSADTLIAVESQELADSLVDDHRNFAKDAMASQDEQSLPDLERRVPPLSLFALHPTSPPDYETDIIDFSTHQISETDLKEEGVSLQSCIVRPECDSNPCGMDMLEQDVSEADYVDPLPTIQSPTVHERTFSEPNFLVDSIHSTAQDHHSMVRLVLDLNIQTLKWLSQAREASDDQQTILDVGMNHQQTDDPSPESKPCVLGLERDNVHLLHTAESLASTTVDSMPMQVHSPQCILSPHVCAAELELPAELDNISTRDLVPSPTPSEQGSLHRSSITLESHIHPEGRPPLSPSTSESSAGYLPEADPSSTPSSPLSESSIVFVSAESVPEYLRENRAYLVATSAPSRPSSAASSYIRLPSVTTSLDSMPPQEDPDLVEASLADAPTNSPSRLYCRICLRDPCEDLTATMCGHVFCNRCIVDAVMTRSACPVCSAPTLLYCLFRLDI